MRQRHGILGGAVAASLIAASWGSPAAACSYSVGFTRPTQVPCATGATLPINKIETAPRDPKADAGALFDPDEALSARLVACPESLGLANACTNVFRLRPGTPEGAVVRSACGGEFLVGRFPDTTPPARPTIADVVIDLKTDPADTGCLSCPDTDAVTIFVTNVSDESAPRDQMQVAIYVGRTEDEARSRTTIDHLALAFEAGDVGVGPKARIDESGGPALAVHAVIGESVDRERRDWGMFRAGPICVAVEMMDWAGNLSPRSAPVCFDHTNESDPHVRTEDGSCQCAMPGARRGSAALPIATVLALTWLRRRRRRPPRGR